jgi:hypothetical protein
MSTPEPPRPESFDILGIEIPADQQTPLVMALIAVIQRQQKEIEELKDEVQRLKGTTRKPDIKPSRLLKDNDAKKAKRKKRPGSAKRHKTKQLAIDEIVILKPDQLPDGARLEGYRDFVVQDLVIRPHNTRYRRAVYRLPDGTLRVAQRPENQHGHFGPELRRYILMQAHQNHVTQNRLHEELQELGVDISAGQISAILLNGHDEFHAEKDELLPVGREISGYLHCDDTSARHKGQAAVCTHLGNELFASFSTTESKSRLNFLRLLCQPEERYRWCEEAAQSLVWLGGGKKLVAKMDEVAEDQWIGRDAWEQKLDELALEKPQHRRLVSEAALCGTLLTETWYEDLGLVSDDAPQFKVFGFLHGLCWVHGERKIDRLIPLTTRHRNARELAQQTFWELYDRLKAYREGPTPDARASIESDFDALCTRKTGYPDLNVALERLHAKREGFLAVLSHPHLPLHNNLSENDIREYARLRKISAGTRSDQGRRCRDTFLSLKKTCRKLGVSFWSYLGDRIHGTGAIGRLSELMRSSAAQDVTPVSSCPP